MTQKATAKRKTPTPEEIVAEQKRQAAKATTTRKAAAAPSKAVTVAGTAVAMPPAPDTRTEAEKYVDEIAPASIVGRMIKFSKDARFVTSDDDEPVDPATEFIALCDETLVGWIRFHQDNETPPDRIQGLLYDGFKMPPRETLGDLDETEWPEGLSGAREDPWRHQMLLVLQQTETRELFTFVTGSQTGRRAIAHLLRHYNRMRKTNAGEVPVVRLRVSGFTHRDPRVGWVSTPAFTIVGRAPRESAAKPDTSLATALNDEIPALL